MGLDLRKEIAARIRKLDDERKDPKTPRRRAIILTAKIEELNMLLDKLGD